MEASMTPDPRPWKKYILTRGALYAVWWPYPPFIWNNNTSLGLILCILTWTTPHGLNVTSVTPPSIYSVVPGSLKLLSGIRDSFVHFSAAETFKSGTMSLAPDLPSSNVLGSVELLPQNTCSRSTSMSLVLKMVRKQRCPDGKDDKTPKKKQKKGTPKTPSSDISPTDHHGDSAHKDQLIGNFTASVIAAVCGQDQLLQKQEEGTWYPQAGSSSIKRHSTFLGGDLSLVIDHLAFCLSSSEEELSL